MKTVNLKTDDQAKEEISASNWSVKSVKTGPGHDAPSMSCSLYKDGKRVATVWDDSWGGGFQFTWVKGQEAVEKEFDAYAKSFTCSCSSLDGKSLQYNMDIVVDELVNRFEEDKTYKRQCKTKTLYSLECDDKGQYWILSNKFDEKCKAHLVKKYGKKLKEIINERF